MEYEITHDGVIFDLKDILQSVWTPSMHKKENPIHMIFEKRTYEKETGYVVSDGMVIV